MSKRLPERGPFWLSYRLHDVANKLADLLAWAEFPDPASMTGKWLEATKDGISIAIRLATEAGPDADLLVKLKRAKKLAFELAIRMREIPDLSVQPVPQWTMAGHRQLWDDLSALARELATEADKPTAPTASKADPAPAPPTASTPAIVDAIKDLEAKVNELAESVERDKGPGEQMDPVSIAITFMVTADREGRKVTMDELETVAGCDKSTLYRDPLFNATRKALRAKKRSNIGRGIKDSSGNIEMEWDPNDDEE